MIHGEHPFLPPDRDRDQVRRFRGRLPSAVTLWTAQVPEDSREHPYRAGLPVSSMLVADGEPGYVAGLVDPDSDLWAVLERSGKFVVQVLAWEHRALADAFAGVAPAPGGAFRLGTWVPSDWGPRLESAGTWAGCAVRETRSLGWGTLVVGEFAGLHLDGPEGDQDTLVHLRGRYRHLA